MIGSPLSARLQATSMLQIANTYRLEANTLEFLVIHVMLEVFVQANAFIHIMECALKCTMSCEFWSKRAPNTVVCSLKRKREICESERE